MTLSGLNLKPHQFREQNKEALQDTLIDFFDKKGKEKEDLIEENVHVSLEDATIGPITVIEMLEETSENTMTHRFPLICSAREKNTEMRATLEPTAFTHHSGELDNQSIEKSGYESRTYKNPNMEEKVDPDLLIEYQNDKKDQGGLP